MRALQFLRGLKNAKKLATVFEMPQMTATAAAKMVRTFIFMWF